MFDDSNVVLHCEQIEKIYPGTKALDHVSFDVLRGKVNVLIGENGAGKTTTIGKLAAQLGKAGRKVWIGAADTFRAAAADQLEIWANRAECEIVRSVEGLSLIHI